MHSILKYDKNINILVSLYCPINITYNAHAQNWIQAEVWKLCDRISPSRIQSIQKCNKDAILFSRFQSLLASKPYCSLVEQNHYTPSPSLLSRCSSFETILIESLKIKASQHDNFNPQPKRIIIIDTNLLGDQIMPKNPSKPLSPQNLDLDAALNALLVSAKVIYFNFEIVFRLIGLLILAYVAYKVGKLTVSEPIATKVKSIQTSIRKNEQQKQGIPERIRKLNKTYWKFIVLFFLVFIGGGALLYTEQIKFDPIYLTPGLAIPLVLLIIKSIHISILSKKTEQFSEKQKQIRERVKEINKELGSKVQASLRANLCRDKLSVKQNTPSHICTKKDCQEMRGALRTKYEIIRNLTECALQFQWCSACKSRKPFDEMVKFEPKPLPPVRDGDTSEEEEIEMRITYLLENLQQIYKWISDAGPCNCSKLYMEQIIKARKSSNKALKEINARIEQLEKQRQATSAALQRSDSKMSNASNTSNISSNASVSSTSRVHAINVIRKNE